MTARILIVLFSFFLFACEQEAEQAPPYQFFTVGQMKTAAELRQQALTQGSGAYGFLEELVTANPKRLAGSGGERAAESWIEDKYKGMGFDKVWLEPVTIHAWERKYATARVTTPENLDFNITSLGKSASTPKGGVMGQVVEFKTYQDLVDADASEVEGKIVFISNRMERTITGEGYGTAVIARGNGHAQVAKKGGLALLIRSIGTDESDNPHTGAMQMTSDGLTPEFQDPQDGQAWSVAYGQKTVASGALSNQDADALEALLAVGNPVIMFVDIQNQDIGEVTGYNVIAELTGSSRPDEIVVTGGHLDAWDLGSGAMDDGMGVAITTAAVKMIADLPQRPARTIRLVAFAAEEIGLFGGFAYAEAHKDENTVFVMESDLGIGKIWEMKPYVADDEIAVLREAWRVVAPTGVAWNPDNSTIDVSDLYPVVSQNGAAGATLAGDATFYFDYHHTADDQLDLIRTEDLDFNTAAYAAILYLAADYDGSFSPPAPAEDQ